MTSGENRTVTGIALLLDPHESAANEAVRAGVKRCGATDTVIARSSEEAAQAMALRPSVVFFRLSSERLNGKRIERVLHARSPRTPLVAFGPPVGTPVVFRLASLGVAAYLDEPFTELDVASCLSAMALPERRLARIAGLEVGLRDMKEAQKILRLTMCAEALRQSGGSRRAAARILGVDRRAVQKIAEELKGTLELPEFAPRPGRPAAAPPQDANGDGGIEVRGLVVQ